MNVRQRIPDFVDVGRAPFSAAGITWAELMALPWIQRWKEPIAAGYPVCEHWELTHRDYRSMGEGEDWLLMAIMSDGKYWVVAYLTEPTAEDRVEMAKVPGWKP